MSDDLRGNVIVMPVMMGGRESSDPAFDPGARHSYTPQVSIHRPPEAAQPGQG